MWCIVFLNEIYLFVWLLTLPSLKVLKELYALRFILTLGENGTMALPRLYVSASVGQ